MIFIEKRNISKWPEIEKAAWLVVWFGIAKI
jgi:hypothetical protein